MVFIYLWAHRLVMFLTWHIAGFSGEFEADRLIATLPKWGPEFCITFEIFIRTVSKAEWCSAFLFTTTGSGGGEFGNRIPGIWTRNTNILYLPTQIGTNGNYGHSASISLETWYTVKLEQTKNYQGEVRACQLFGVIVLRTELFKFEGKTSIMIFWLISHT